jgi:G:T/U-mismatch repair DNA glycosylase
MINNHPFEPFLPHNTKRLIIGTIPPQRFCILGTPLFEDDVNFFYGSKDNYFWDLIGEIFNKKFLKQNTEQAINQRKEFLKNEGIGITDIVETCERINNSASDKKLIITKYKDLKKILLNYNIDTLIYTSEYVKKCINGEYVTYHKIDKSDKKKQSVKLFGKEYSVWILYSPSPQALRGLGKNGIEIREKQYLKVFLNK